MEQLFLKQLILCPNFVKIQFSQKSITGFQKLVLINMYLESFKAQLEKALFIKVHCSEMTV